MNLTLIITAVILSNLLLGLTIAMRDGRMKNSKVLLGCILILSIIFGGLGFFHSIASAAIHYVDADAAGGGDGSWATPLKTIAEVNAHSFVTGDDIYFQTTDTFSDAMLDIDWEGSSGNISVIGAYEAEGDFVMEGAETLPILTYETNNTVSCTTANTDYITIQDLNIINTQPTLNYRAILIQADGCTNFILTRLNVDTVKACLFVTGVHTITVSDSTFDSTSSGNGLTFYGKNDFSQQVQNGTITGNVVTINSGDCISIHRADGDPYTRPGPTWVIRENELTGATEDGIDTDPVSGYVYIEYNHIHDCTRAGIGLGHSCQNHVVRYNKIEDCATLITDGGVIGIGDADKGGAKVCDNIDISYNIIAGDWHTGIMCRTDGDDIRVQNNTFVQEGTSYRDGKSTTLRVVAASDVTNLSFINNVIEWQNTNANEHYAGAYLQNTARDPGSTGSTKIVMDYNHYYSTNANTDLFRVDNSTDQTLTEIKTNFPDAEDNSSTGDPLLHATGFYPEGASPIKNTGSNLGEAYNQALLNSSSWPDAVQKDSQDSHGAEWEKGAFLMVEDVPPIEDFADITFFWRCEAADFSGTDGTDDYSPGDNTVALVGNAAINTDAVMLGTNGLDCPTAGDYGQLVIDTRDIISEAEGRIGFNLKFITPIDNTVLFQVRNDDDNRIRGRINTTDELELGFTYSGTAVWFNTSGEALNLATSTKYFVEFSWNTTSNAKAIYVNGVSILTNNTAISAFAGAPTEFYIGNPSAVAADFYIDHVIVSNDDTRDLYAISATESYDELSGASSPTVTDVGHIADPTGTSVYTSNKTETWSTVGDLKYVGLQLSEQITAIGNPYQSYITLFPTYGTLVGRYHSQVVISSVYYLVYEFKIGSTWNYSNETWDDATGHRGTDLQTAAVGTSLQLNGATMQDGDGNDLVTALPSTDIGTITLANPKTANYPWEFNDSDKHSDAVTAGWCDVPNDVIVVRGTDNVTVQASGTSGNQVTYYIQGLTGNVDVNSKDYVTIRGTNRVTGSVLNSGGTGVVLLPYNPPMMTH